MTTLLEIREQIKLYYSKYEMFILPVLKFLLAFICLSVLNSRMGYMSRIDNGAIVLMVALLCSFLPTGCLVLFGTLFSLLHMYALSMEVAALGLALYLILFLLFFRFTPRDSLMVVVTPLLFALKIPYVIPIIAGLLFAPTAAISVGFGVVVHYFLQNVITNAPTIKTMSSGDAAGKIKLLVDGLMSDKAMIVVIVAFAITLFIVYVIRSLPIDYAWTIAMVAGAIANVLILLVGDLMYDINLSVGSVLLGSVLALLIGKVLEFFKFCLDFKHTEKVQFEDDEYYYYVKAVPKLTVAATDRTVKQINNSRRNEAGERRVTTERTGRPTQAEYDADGVRTDYRGARGSVTMGNTSDQQEETVEDDYEELF